MREKKIDILKKISRKDYSVVLRSFPNCGNAINSCVYVYFLDLGNSPRPSPTSEQQIERHYLSKSGQRANSTDNPNSYSQSEAARIIQVGTLNFPPFSRSNAKSFTYLIGLMPQRLQFLKSL